MRDAISKPPPRELTPSRRWRSLELACDIVPEYVVAVMPRHIAGPRETSDESVVATDEHRVTEPNDRPQMRGDRGRDGLPRSTIIGRDQDPPPVAHDNHAAVVKHRAGFEVDLETTRGPRPPRTIRRARDEPAITR